MTTNAEHAGLGSVLPMLRGLFDGLEVGPVCRVVGPVRWAGGARPLPSSVAELRVAGASVWVPAPLDLSDENASQAQFFQHAGRMLVMPIMRQFVRRAPTGKSLITEKNWPVEYVTLGDWLKDALTRWRFEVRDVGGAADTGRKYSTACDWLRSLREVGGQTNPQHGLSAVARIICFALLGSHDARHYDAARSTYLRIPECAMWLRPFEDRLFAREVARRLVMTCRFLNDAGGKQHGQRPDYVPTANVGGRDYRIRPAATYDWGLDPIHSPEGPMIRLTGRIGLEVDIRNRRLVPQDPGSAQLSVASSRVPFAEYNDPIRLMMAANMQTQAVPLPALELPLIRQDQSGLEPPGVNLRVGYLAWEGWNHEDAWVISESAARRLTMEKNEIQTIAVRSVEEAPELQVQQGERVSRSDLLVKRFVCPALLTNTLWRLVCLSDASERVQLRPEIGDRATVSGEVVHIERWIPSTGEGIPEGWQLSPALPSDYREVIRVHVRAEVPLAVGDKIANRHGNKGIVGAILPDAQMPRWRGKPLEALIDPISVLNRSNWGQLYETLVGGVRLERDEPQTVAGMSGEQVFQLPGMGPRGRSRIEPAAETGWLSAEVQAVAGVQFVMRLPQRASAAISASPARGRRMSRGLRRRRQRFGEMEQWALLAHDVIRAPTCTVRLSPEATSLRNLLASAGFSLEIEEDALTLRHAALDEDPPDDFDRLELRWKESQGSAGTTAGDSPTTDGACEVLTTGALAEAYDKIDDVDGARRAAMVFVPGIDNVLIEGQGSRDVRWIPIVPRADRPKPSAGPDVHELTKDIRRVVRLYRRANNRSSSAAGMLPEDAEQVRDAIQRLLRHARVRAVGSRATGPNSSKWAFLRRRVLGRRLDRSARAVAAPSGTMRLRLDEIGVPEGIARAVLGMDATTPDDELNRLATQQEVWIKRDPVLHRWGLLRVRMRIIRDDAEVIRLPASMLRPMGADYDGDQVALFGHVPGLRDDLSGCRPTTLAWDDLTDSPMFIPGKQYLYGLHLLAREPDRVSKLQHALAQAGAPSAWATDSSPKDALTAWMRAAHEAANANGEWWAIIEDHALRALSQDPGMGLGLVPPDELENLEVIQCGASRLAAEQGGLPDAVLQILNGRGLEAFERSFDKPNDAPAEPISDALVAGKTSIGHFGGALRRLIYAAEGEEFGTNFVRRAQCLTEQVSQEALSVKSGESPMRYYDYGAALRRLLKGQKRYRDGESPELQELLDDERLGQVWEGLRAAMPNVCPRWQQWLQEPHRLLELLASAPEAELRLPLRDLRVRLFLDTGD